MSLSKVLSSSLFRPSLDTGRLLKGLPKNLSFSRLSILSACLDRSDSALIDLMIDLVASSGLFPIGPCLFCVVAPTPGHTVVQVGSEKIRVEGQNHIL